MPDGLVVVAEYASYADAFEHSVVVLATGQACWIVLEDEQHRLLVESTALAHVHDQLARYDRESVGWPPAPITDHGALRAPELLTPFLWSLLVLTIFREQAGHPAWLRDGALDPTAVFGRGEWWRIGTALFLHGGAEHVISNALGGILVFSAVLTTLGRWRGWLQLAVASLWGNLAIAALNVSRDYRSIGASTAIFAGLGLLTGRAVCVGFAHRGHPLRWRSIFVPIATGCTVLALYGAGTGNVDVPAHASGFIAGVVIGFLTGSAMVSRSENRE
jgi:rhomboid protease GluP